VTIKLELWLSEDDCLYQVDSLYDDLINLLVHAHFDKLVECYFKSFLLSIDCSDFLNYFFKCCLSILPLRALQAFN
jgi:hypothetical protein